MKESIAPVIERLSSLRRAALRRVAANQEIQLIHAEILEYLALCNHYSNTPQAVVEYLSQTKGSISQSLKLMEGKGLILRKVSKEDKRSLRLSLTAKGRRRWEQISEALPRMEVADISVSNCLAKLLQSLQTQQGNKGFSICHTCRYNEILDKTHFRCGLTGEDLSLSDTQKICREHEFAEL